MQRGAVFFCDLPWDLFAKLQLIIVWETNQEKRQLVFFTPLLHVLLMTHLTFGRFDTEEEAVAIANATDVGLAGRPHLAGWQSCSLLKLMLEFAF